MDAIKNLKNLLILFLDGKSDVIYNIFSEAISDVEREMANKNNEIANLKNQLDHPLHSNTSDTSNLTLADNFFDNFKVSIGRLKDSFHDCTARIDDEK